MTDAVYNADCMCFMPTMADNSVDFTLTDIPYNAVNRVGGGLRKLDKRKADILTFDISAFLNQVYRVTKNSICIFCGKEQFSEIYKFFTNRRGTTRPIVWEKSNPSPMNGKYIYLSGIELAVWHKKRGAKTFNAFCKNSVFKYPNGSSKLHPTAKNIQLLKEIILDNTNVGDVVFDPCAGSGNHLIAAKECNRHYLGIEVDKMYYSLIRNRSMQEDFLNVLSRM